MIKVLVIDDHAIVREGIRRILLEVPEIEAVDDAEDGAEGLRAARCEHYQVILLDIAMPGLDGLDVLKQLRRERPEAAVLIFSMYPEAQYAIRALRAGAAGYLTKDRATEELVEAVRRVASGGRYVTPTLAERMADELVRGEGRSPHEALSDRELQVMLQIASGKTVSQIAAELGLSVKTISTYRSRVLEKMALRTNAELTRYVVQLGLLP